MPLSEHEQRILDEIERRLAAEDPKFARSTAVATKRGVAVRRVKRAAAAFVIGLGLLIAGLVLALGDANLLMAFGLPGFALMVSSVVVLARASKELGPTQGQASNWLSKAEEHWRKRFDRGNGR